MESRVCDRRMEEGERQLPDHWRCNTEWPSVCLAAGCCCWQCTVPEAVTTTGELPLWSIPTLLASGDMVGWT